LAFFPFFVVGVVVVAFLNDDWQTSWKGVRHLDAAGELEVSSAGNARRRRTRLAEPTEL